MTERLLKFSIFCLILTGFSFLSCGEIDKESQLLTDSSSDIINGDTSNDIISADWISPTFTLMNLITGNITGEQIVDTNFIKQSHAQNILINWDLQNGDIFFFRGDLIKGIPYGIGNTIYSPYVAIVPLEDIFYWNGVGLYQDGFIYQIMPTEDGSRIYKTGLWTLGSYCVIVQASSSLSLPENSINTETLQNIHKLKVKRGHLKAAKMNPNMDGSFTPPGLVWKYYQNQGKNIRKDDAGEYIRAEDFIGKTDEANGWFESLTPDLTIKNVLINMKYQGSFDCSKVY